MSTSIRNMPPRPEEALQQSEERFRLLAESVIDYAIFMLDPRGYIVSWNAGAQRIKGYQAHEIIGQHFSRFYPAEDLAWNKPGYELREAAAEGRFEDEGWRLRKDGSRFWANVVITALRDKTGLVGFAKVTRDLTERKYAEEAVRQSEERLAEAQQIARLGSWHWNLLTNAVSWSDELYRIYGLEPQCTPVSHEHFLRHAHPDDLASIREFMQQARQAPQPFAFDYRIIPVNSSGAIPVRVVHVRGQVVYDPQGQPIALSGIGQDVTEIRLAETALKIRTRQQAVAAQLGHQALIVHDLTQLAEEIAKQIAETLSVDCVLVWQLSPDRETLRLWAGTNCPAEFVTQLQVGTGLDSQAGYALVKNTPVIVPDLRTETRFGDRTLRAGHQVVSGVSVVIQGRERPFGVLSVHTTSPRMFSSDDVSCLQTIANILAAAIERAQTELELEQSREQLRNLSAKLQAAREDERARLSREIRDELGGLLAGLKMDIVQARRKAAQLDITLPARLAALSDLIDQTISTVRRIATELRPGLLDDFGLFVAMKWQLNEFQTRSGIQCQLRSTLDQVNLDRDSATAVFRIFQETLTNVARHAGASQIDVRLEETEGYIVLEVRDNGRGIRIEEVNGIRSMGLLGIRERIRLLDGALHIQGAPGQGTTVQVKIPLRQLDPQING